MIIFSKNHSISKNTDESHEMEIESSFQNMDKGFIDSILENDKSTIDNGKLISSAINYGIGSFIPDLIFEQLVKNYSIAKQIYGESIIRLISGYEPDYIDKNINVGEFRKELKEKIHQKIDELKKQGVLKKDYSLSEKGIELASLVLYFEEIDKIVPKGSTGEKISKKQFTYGEKDDLRAYKKGDYYSSIALKKSVKAAIRRKHSNFENRDLYVFDKKSKVQTYVIYALDASGSMKGKKIEACKKAGIALAYKAIEEKDKVGLIVFSSDVTQLIKPTSDFTRFLKEITRIRASKETDIASTLKKSIEMFPDRNVTKHLILITDALPTKGKEDNNPENATLEEASIAISRGITISVIGVDLEEKGKDLAKKIVELGKGRLYVLKDLESIENVDAVVLEDYYGID